MTARRVSIALGVLSIVAWLTGLVMLSLGLALGGRLPWFVGPLCYVASAAFGWGAHGTFLVYPRERQRPRPVSFPRDGASGGTRYQPKRSGP